MLCAVDNAVTAIPSIALGVFMQLMGPSSAGFMYSDTGGGGPPVVFLHGVLMNGTLWDHIVDSLYGRYRCIVPELPFGLILHFAIDGPDLHSNVAPEHGAVFLYSAMGLAAVE